jgi:hypothetical protein
LDAPTPQLDAAQHLNQCLLLHVLPQQLPPCNVQLGNLRLTSKQSGMYIMGRAASDAWSETTAATAGRRQAKADIWWLTPAPAHTHHATWTVMSQSVAVTGAPAHSHAP